LDSQLAATGDLWQVLSLTFTDNQPTASFNFGQDSDNDIRRIMVPEPETYTLMVAGLAVMGFMIRRRRGAH